MTLRWDAKWCCRRVLIAITWFAFAAAGGAQTQDGGGRINLSTSKLLGVVAGSPQRVNSLPFAMAVSPDRRYVLTVNGGYGTAESQYDQSLAVMDTLTGKVTDFSDKRTGLKSKQALYSGLAFSGDGRHVYASMASETDPGGKEGGPGSGIAVYGFAEGRIVPERVIRIPMQRLAAGRRTKLAAGGADGALGVPYPAGIAVLPGAAGLAAGERLLVADNLSDDALLIDVASGEVVTRFDLSESDAVPGTYPVAVAVSKDGARGYVALWNASEVVELDLLDGRVGRRLALFKPSDPVKPGTHPAALAVSPDGRRLYVALANRDAVAAVDVSGGIPTSGSRAARHGAPKTLARSSRQPKFAVVGYFDTRLPGQSYFGAEPDALAVSGDGRTVYAADMQADAVAVLDARGLRRSAVRKGMVEPAGFIPTEWMPVSLGLIGERLFVASGKGHGTGPNNFSQRPNGATDVMMKRGFTYIGTLLYGSLAAVDLRAVDLKASTAEAVAANRIKAAKETIPWRQGSGRIKHVIYLIRENRTYDQVFGDLAQDGRRVGNGDSGLTMYGAAVTPNAHKLAAQFGVLDNFFDSAEVSGDGHVWSNAAIGTDYLEKTWQQNYRNDQRTYDYEGMVADGYPLLQRIPDVNEPASGYMWGNAEAHGETHYNFGEYISSTFCGAKKSSNSQQGPLLAGSKCAQAEIRPGEAIPEEWGGGVNKWPWGIPLLSSNVATKPELAGHFAEEAPDFNLRVPDQIRAEVFLRHLAGWVKDREAGTDTMPNYITMRLGNDHTAGTVPGGPTPKASVADNDLALGRIVDAVSHSAYWDDTAVVVLEDDAQNGADHVDAHRSVALLISKYAPHAGDGGVFVDSHFYTTVSVIRTMEALLGLPPMNNNDALAPLIGSLFSGPGDQAAFAADTRNRENGLIYTANAETAAGAKESMKMDFSQADRADTRTLNSILWRDAKGDAPMPEQITRKTKKAKDDDD